VIHQREIRYSYPENTKSDTAHLSTLTHSKYDQNSGKHSIEHHSHFTVRNSKTGEKHQVGINDPDAIKTIKRHNNNVDTDGFEKVHKAQNPQYYQEQPSKRGSGSKRY